MNTHTYVAYLYFINLYYIAFLFLVVTKRYPNHAITAWSQGGGAVGQPFGDRNDMAYKFPVYHTSCLEYSVCRYMLLVVDGLSLADQLPADGAKRLF